MISSPKTVQPDASHQTEVEQFTLALSQACALLKQFGKTPAELRTLRDGFLQALSDIPIADLIKALWMHVNTADDIPTPRQLRAIVQPNPPEWKPDWPVYIALKKRVQRDGYYPFGSEREFLKRCDEYAINRAMQAGEPANDDERTARLLASGQKTYAIEGPDA